MGGSILGKIGWDGKRLFEKSRMEVKDCRLRNCSQFRLRSRMRWIINCCVFIYNDDVSEVLTPNSLLYGRKLEFENKCVDEGHFEVAEGDVNCGWENVWCKSEITQSQVIKQTFTVAYKGVAYKKNLV